MMGIHAFNILLKCQILLAFAPKQRSVRGAEGVQGGHFAPPEAHFCRQDAWERAIWPSRRAVLSIYTCLLPPPIRPGGRLGGVFGSTGVAPVDPPRATFVAIRGVRALLGPLLAPLERSPRLELEKLLREVITFYLEGVR